jgi:DNA modification methylase
MCTRGLGDFEIYDWFPYTQRFPSKFLRKIFKRREFLQSRSILDPFMGSGNTLVACVEFGKIGYGLDISPLFWFITNVKIGEYTKEDFQGAVVAIKNISENNNVDLPILSSFKKLFVERQLNNLLKLREVAYDLNPKSRKILLFALVSKLIDLSRAKRYGKGLRLKMKKGRPPNVGKVIMKKIKRMKYEYIDFQKKARIGGRCFPILADARRIPLKNKMIEKNDEKRIDLVLTSPPYCNSSDYIEMYKLEHWFLDFVSDYDEFKRLSYSTVRSHTTFLNRSFDWKHPVLEEMISAFEKTELWNKRIPFMITGYFDDLRKSLNEIYSVLSFNGKVLIVLGNSCYSRIIIPTDLLIADAANEVGFRVERIEVLRQLFTSGQQWRTLSADSRKFLRESMICLAK